MLTPAPEDDAEYMDRYITQSRQIIGNLRAARTAIRRLRGQATSADGLIEASADGQGGVTDLRLDPRALRLGEAALGRQVTAVLQAAQEDAARQAQEIVEEARESAAALPPPLDEDFVHQRVEQAAQAAFDVR
ncbi:YbaB/EbfC family nucleoid-associated protein [Nonomuraea rhizosphaerae]|uniref:YbaB/EbfC family nucleoid-associated protein n=1 Tax=Nonomuraea rhizosphaerae TaxID=2665663 RepID=UPI001C600943|nr:YbaB/EbfC family nucleoid-associated protein [Nonomuraea rhizosphaerae]